jgi:hypothetical protein
MRLLEELDCLAEPAGAIGFASLLEEELGALDGIVFRRVGRRGYEDERDGDEQGIAARMQHLANVQ